MAAYQPPAPADDDRRTWSWCEASESWLSAPTLAALQSDAWARIKAARSQAEVSPVESAGRLFDADTASQQRIGGAVQMAQLAIQAGHGEIWSITWTLADNTVVTLTALEVIDLGLAVATQISAAHARGRYLRDRINAATSADELAAITWS